MNERKGEKFKLKPVFLLGSRSSFIRKDKLGFIDIEDESEQNAKTDEILQRLGLQTETKVLVRKDKDLYHLDTNIDAFIVFAHSPKRFSSIITLVDTDAPMIVTSEEGALGEALDTYQCIAEYDNVKVALSFEEIRRRIRILKAVKELRATKVCVFDTGKRPLDAAPWYKNPLLKGKFKTQYVDVKNFENNYKGVDKVEAENLAKEWMKESEVIEPSSEDVTKSARLYIAMKSIIETTEADAAYVLWCAQFEPMLRTKMCFAIAKLNDGGHLTGCWRGENLLPMLILPALSGKPVFFGEIHTYLDGIMSLRHCAVPQKIANCQYVLRKWRDRKGTVTGYCEMPKGEVTIVNAGQGDRIVVMRGDALQSRDLGGDNCRTTVWVKIEDEKVVHNLTARELAMVYGDYVEETRKVGKMLGIDTL